MPEIVRVQAEDRSQMTVALVNMAVLVTWDVWLCDESRLPQNFWFFAAGPLGS
jgi:hypothetical protein